MYKTAKKKKVNFLYVVSSVLYVMTTRVTMKPFDGDMPAVVNIKRFVYPWSVLIQWRPPALDGTILTTQSSPSSFEILTMRLNNNKPLFQADDWKFV